MNFIFIFDTIAYLFKSKVIMKQFFILFFILFFIPLSAVDITDNIHIRGFATLDATINTSEDTRGILPTGNSYVLEQNELAYDYSSIGAQLEYDFSDSVNIMAQGLYSKRDMDEDYEASLEWLLLGYSFGNDYKLRVGKMKVPFMKATETRYINYSFLWTRPQIANNGVNGFDDMYGVDLIKRTYIDDVDLEFQLTLGQPYHKSSLDEAKYLYNFSALASYERSWLRFSFGQNIFDHFNSQAKLIKKDTTLTFISAESELHFGETIVYAGYGFNKNSEIPNEKFAYFSLAYEIDKITPYLLYSYHKVDQIPNNSPGKPPAPLGRDSYVLEQSHALGFRYDIYFGFALKAQYNLLKSENYNPMSEEKSDSDIYTLTLDMVF